MNQGWTRILVPGADSALELLGGELLEMGAEGFTTEGDALAVFFHRPADSAETLRADIATLVHALVQESLLPDGEVTAEEVTEEDWVGRWRRSLGPIRAGEHFVVIPPGVEAELNKGDIALRLEPRMAFGTGEHATTRMALELLETTVQPGDRVIDMGCGNGVLTLGALLLGAGYAFGVDNEQEAVAETLENAANHGVGDRIVVRLGDVLNLDASGPYDLLLANIFVNPILAGLPSWLPMTTDNARFIFTGVQAGEEEARLIEGVGKLGLEVEETRHLDGWFAARCRRVRA